MPAIFLQRNYADTECIALALARLDESIKEQLAGKAAARRKMSSVNNMTGTTCLQSYK